MRLAGILGIIAVMFSISPAQSYYITGTELYKSCSIDAPQCLSYIFGIYDMAEAAQIAEITPKALCVSTDVIGVQLKLIVKNYLEKHPQDFQKAAGPMVWLALREAFPCPGK